MLFFFLHTCAFLIPVPVFFPEVSKYLCQRFLNTCASGFPFYDLKLHMSDLNAHQQEVNLADYDVF